MSNEIIQKLRAPFPEDRIEWRIQSCGTKSDGSVWARVLAYIDNRSAMERLDEVFGLAWSHEERFTQIGNKAVCVVTITIDNWTSSDAEKGVRFSQRHVAGSCQVELDKTDDIDPFKSAASGAMKRAVVNLGIGRYLYSLPEAWAIISDKGKHQGKTKDGTRFRWNAPSIEGALRASEEIETVGVQHDFPKSKPKQVDAPATEVVSDGTWKTVVIPFGKQQGKTLGSLEARSLKWWQENYQPKPYKGNISEKDKAFRDALDASAGKISAPVEIKSEETSDDVPF
jgi:hypothetical protein